jgi:endonuclease/exonuclease/phosphatase family metal-dependent hydrolase
VPRSLHRIRHFAAWLGFFLLSACGAGESPAAPDTPPPGETAITIPARGTASTLDLVTWNLEFFGSTSGGPSDEAGQLRHMREVIFGTDADLWAVEEVSNESAFQSLVAQLPGYSGLLANDPTVGNGPAFYNDFGGTEQKVGIIFKDDVVEIVSAQVVLTDRDFDFAGRPPLEIRARVSVGGVAREVTLIVLHAKAGSAVESWERRASAAVALKDYLDDRWPDDPVWVLGDWNDDVDESITSGRDTPYRPFVDADPSWIFVSEPLSAAGETSILGFSDVIDHILASDESMAWYEPGSVLVYRVDDFIPEYETTTSDHLPVLARFRLSG